MTLVRTSALNGIATVVRILTAIGLNKVLAVYVGPAGYALFGQFSNAITVAGAVSGGAIGAGVTKYTAQHFDDPDRQRAIWRAAARYIAIAATLTSAAVLIGSGTLANELLGDRSFAIVFVLLACSLPLLALNALLLAIMNGKKDVRGFVIQNISASIVGAVVAAVLAIAFGPVGALIALAVNQTVVFAITLWMCRHAAWLRLDSFIGKVDRATVRPLLGFALMAMTSALIAPLGQVLVRDHLIERFGAVAAGEWQATFKISEIYLTLFTTTLTVYYLPRLAEIRDKTDLWQEIARVYRVVLPIAAAAAGIIFLLRSWIATTLFTAEFLGMIELFGWQLFGDVLKIGSWILGFVMIGRAMVRWFIFTEIVFGATWVLLTFALTKPMGLPGAPAAFACNYAIYWLFMIWLLRHELRDEKG